MFVNVKNSLIQPQPKIVEQKRPTSKIANQAVSKPKTSRSIIKNNKNIKDASKNSKSKLPLKPIANDDTKKKDKEAEKIVLNENTSLAANLQKDKPDANKLIKKEKSSNFTLESSRTYRKPRKCGSKENINPNVDASLSSSLNLENYITNITLSKNKIPTDQYRQFFSQLVKEDYSSSILKSLLGDEICYSDFLSHHKITERMRCRMVDWMIEVLTNYHCDQSTFFEAVNLMDRYFKEAGEAGRCFMPEELHLIGVTSMFLASKYQDIYPLRLRIVHEKIAHRKLSCQEIINKEQDLARLLNYNIGLPTMWDFINLYIQEIFFVKENGYHISNKVLIEKYDLLSGNEESKEEEQEEDKKNEEENEQPSKEKVSEILNKLYTKNMLNLLNHVCLYLTKMNCHDYNLMQKKPSLLAASTLYVAVKICEQINKEDYINDYFNEKLIILCEKEENEIIKTAQEILYNAQNFDTIFSGLQNLKQVHFNAIIELKVTK